MGTNGKAGVGVRRRAGGHFTVAAALPVMLTAFTASAATAQDHPGKPVYEKWCAGCHGAAGKADGPAAAYMLPRPRDFTKALYQIRTTASGAIPTDEDIRHIIDEGMPGTAMPGWKETLTNDERTQLVAYVKTFSRFFQGGTPPEAVSFGGGIRGGQEAVDSGRALYQKVECWKCHGQSGRGDGQSAPTQKDDEDFPIRPADLTQPWYFNGGGTVDDIYRRLRTGLDGTPMPSFSDLLDSNLLTDDDLWRIAHYVRSLGPEKFPEVSEVVRAARVTALPAAPDDSAWNAVQQFYVPLVGQIIVKPRWFSPGVKGVWVQAVHDGSEVALRLTWTDPSKSPDPVWNEWRQAVQATMEPREDVGPGADAQPVAATAAPAAQTPAATAPGAQPLPATGLSALPDVMIVQFPQRIPSGMERPYFLLGNTRNPVYLWRWQSQPDGVTEMLGKGIARLEPLADGGVTAQSAFSDGQWRLMLRRSIAAADSANRITFAPGQPIPMALFAWDGDNGEAGTRGAISTWYFLFLEQPTSGTVYATPVLAVLLTAGLGLFAVGRAQRNKKT
jgi:mono/diheme cytochrome c family protein